MKIARNHVVEIALRSTKAYSDPFHEVRVVVSVSGPDGTARDCPAFWAGAGRWKFRFSSDRTGIFSYRTQCSDGSNAGLNGQTGCFEVVPYEGDNPLYRHGAVARRGGDLYLSYGDGTPFFWLADTWWMGFAARLSWPESFQTLTRDRAEKGFTVVQIVAGLYPDMEPFDPRGANEAGFPWDEDFHSVNPAYFDAADRRIECLIEHGIAPCVVGCWGFFMGFAGKQTILKHWQYLIARWAAYPVVWCLAGEANMTFYDDQSMPADEHLRRSRADWTEVAKFVRQRDPFGRLVTIHPTQNGHEQIEDESLLDLDMLQTGHSGFGSVVPTMRRISQAIARGKLPVIDAEVCYEGICNSSFHDVQRYLFLMNMLLGACGHTYGANGIWQVNTARQPYGVSPHGAHWGDTPWEEAYKLPGSFQVGAAKKFLSKFRWWAFKPHPEWIDNPCSGDAMDGCFAAGIPGEARIVFRPFIGGSFWNSDPIRHIEKDVKYRAVYFNPVTGEETDLGPVMPDEEGTWVSPRVTAFQDWVIALIAQR